VGEGNITGKIKEGCTSLEKVCQATGAGMGCGSCRSEVQAILERTLPQQGKKKTEQLVTV
jgi:ferredoxin-nitrate reductase